MITGFTDADLEALAPLVRASEAEGFRFVRRFEADWREGRNRFDRPGEGFFAWRAADALIALGGLNVHDDRTARLRRFYVRPADRRRGVGRALLEFLLRHAARNFSAVVLHTDTAAADAFYRACGFRRIAGATDPTHILDLADHFAVPAHQLPTAAPATGVPRGTRPDPSATSAPSLP